MQTLHAHGEGSSPVLYGDWLIVCWDHEGNSFLYAFDKHSGKQRWKVARDEKTSWSTPLVVEHEGKPQVVVSATRRVRGPISSCGPRPRRHGPPPTAPGSDRPRAASAAPESVK